MSSSLSEENIQKLDTVHKPQKKIAVRPHNTTVKDAPPKFAVISVEHFYSETQLRSTVSV